MDMYGVLVSQTIASTDVMLPSQSSTGYIIGRKGDHKIQGASGVSKQHCKFVLSDGVVCVHDMSVNGTFIDGKKIGPKDSMYDESTSVVFEYHYLLSKSRATRKPLTKQEKVAQLKKSKASARFATAKDLNMLLQRGNSYVVPKNGSPEEISRLIKVSPSAELFTALRDQMKDECTESWLKLFVEIGGLEQLGDVLRYHTTTRGLLEVLECIAIICKYLFGVEMAIDAPGFLDNLALGLDHSTTSLRLGLYKLLASIAIHSLKGHQVVLEAVNKRGKKLKEGRQFLSLVRALAREVDPLFKSAVLTLINHLCNYTSLEPKKATSLRIKFMKLGILDIFAGFGVSVDCGSLDQQIGLFIDHIEADEALKESMKVGESGDISKVIIADDPEKQQLAEKVLSWIQKEASAQQISAALSKEPQDMLMTVPVGTVSPKAAAVASEERQRFQQQIIQMECEHTEKLEAMRLNYEIKLRNAKATAQAKPVAEAPSSAEGDITSPSTPVSKISRQISEAPDSPFDPILQILSSPYGNIAVESSECDGFVPPPAPPPPSFESFKVPQGRFRPNGKMRQLYWAKVPSNKVGGTVFDRLGWEDVDIQPKTVESLFGIAAKKTQATKKPVKGVSKEPVQKGPVRYFDDKRSNNIGIMMSQFRGTGGAAAVRESIMKMDDSKLDIDRVTQLRQLAPDADEEALLKSYTGKPEDLGKVERFFLTLLSIPRLRSRLDCFIFRLRFEEVAEEVQDRLQSAVSACQETLGSAALRDLIRNVLAHGNFLNTSPSVGFDLSFLGRMSDTKTTDRSSTFLHYISSVMESKSSGPFFKLLAEELPSVEAASKFNVKATVDEVHALSNGLKLIFREIKLARTSASEEDGDEQEEDVFSEKMTAFYDEAKDKLRYLQAYVASLARSYAQVQKFFCIAEAVSLEDTTRMLTETILRLESAHKDNQREKLMKERAEARKALRKENGKKLALQKKHKPKQEINILEEIKARRGMQSGRSLQDVNL